MPSRSARDLRHGRQGGRIVDWRAIPPPTRVGERRRLELGPLGRDVVTVVENLPGARIRVRFDRGAELIVPIDLTSPEGTP